MEINTDRDIVKGEGSIVFLRCEGQFTILITTPQDTTFGEGHCLQACQHFALGGIGLVEHKRYLLGTDDSHRYVWFLRPLDFEFRTLVFILQAIDNALQGLALQGDLIKDA